MAFRPPAAEPAGRGEESVWDYPRPPSLQPLGHGVRVEHEGETVAASQRALVVRERAGGPVPYLPPEDVRLEWLLAGDGLSLCEWKGVAVPLDLRMPGERVVEGAAWTYPEPFDDLAEGYGALAGWIAFYPAKLTCYEEQEDGQFERVRPQPGALYGGWLTGRIKGPVKGEPGTSHW